jgi:ATP-binding cassette subfamily B protein
MGSMVRVRGLLASRAARWLAIARLAPSAGLVAAATALAVVVGLLPAAFILATSEAVARVPAAVRSGGVGGDWTALAVALAFAAGAFTLQQVLVPFQAAVGEIVTRRVDGDGASRLMAAAMVEAPMALLEQQGVLERLSDARGAFDRAMPSPGDAVAAGFALIGRYTQLAGALVLVGVVLGLPAAALLGVTAIVIRFGQRGSLGRYAALWFSLADRRRRSFYLRDLATSTAAARELRVLGLVPWLRRRYDEDSEALLRPHWAGRRQILERPFLVYAAVGLVGAAIVLVMLAETAAGGHLGLAQLSIAIQSVLVPMRFGVYFPECDVPTQFGLHAHQTLVELEAAVTRERPPETAGRLAGGSPCREIHLEGITFGYGDHRVLDGVELRIPAGRSTAIVGLNGAGKTTLIKLVAGLYEPQGGRILVDGEDLRRFDRRQWQRRLAVIFQDFVRYELSAADNIGMGAASRMRPPDRAALRTAARRAGALELLEALPDGLDTILSTQYAGGTDLSGGQWHRVALARAYFAVEAGASVLVLDEPTAQLDVRAEVEFFDRFLELTRGLTTIVISHRFSSLRRADQVVVLDGGRVVETGTHATLMELGGRYAALFELQARRFADAPDSGDLATGGAGR